MKQKCDENYWKGMEKNNVAGVPCGKDFDDLEQSTQCPHEYLPPAMTLEDLEELHRKHIGSLPYEDKMTDEEIHGG